MLKTQSFKLKLSKTIWIKLSTIYIWIKVSSIGAAEYETIQFQGPHFNSSRRNDSYMRQ